MNGPRGALAGLMVVVFVLSAAVLQLMLFIGRDVTQSDRFGDVASRVVASPRGADVIAPIVTRRLEALSAQSGVPLPTAGQDAVRRAVRSAITRPGFRDAVRPDLVRAHEDLLTRPEDGLAIPTSSTRPAVVSAFDAAVPGAGSAVPSASQFPVITVPVNSAAQPALRAVHSLGERWALALVALILSGAVAIGVSPRPARTARAMGVSVALLAVVPPLIRWALPPLAEMATRETYGPLSRAFADELTASWGTVSIWTAAAGIVMAIVADLFFRRRG